MSVGSHQGDRLTRRRWLRAAAASRPLRRLLVALVTLIIVDRFEPPLLRSLETARYEDPARDFRFENSDLFGLGPLVAYLREHPRGAGSRVMFLGNSIVFGYGLSAAEALPARYQRLDPSAKAFNVGINGLADESVFLVARATIDAVDLTYVLQGPRQSGDVPATLPSLIPIDEADAARLHLAVPPRTDRLLARPLDYWRLYRDAYRLQAAMFGSSTRQYIYLHKGTLARALIARLRAAPRDVPQSTETPTITMPLATTPPDANRQNHLRERSPNLWRLGDLALARRARLVVLHLPAYSKPLSNADAGEFNRVFAPYARVLVLQIPQALLWDDKHLNSAGATEVARALWAVRPEHEAR